MPVTKILVTGSRHWKGILTVRRALLEHGPGLLIHGDAPGLDRTAASMVTSWSRFGDTTGKRWPTPWSFPADWSRGLHAGHERNQRMVDTRPDVCLAFPDEDSTGTLDCIIRAAKAGTRVVIYPGRNLDGEKAIAKVISYGISHQITEERDLAQVRALLTVDETPPVDPA